MRITITRTIDGPDDLGGVNALETLVREEGFALMRELTGTLWQRLQEQSLRCSHCGSPDVERRGHKAYRLLTAFGPVELPRQRVKCRACGASSQPMDQWLAELGDHRATWLVQELACLAGASWPGPKGTPTRKASSNGCSWGPSATSRSDESPAAKGRWSRRSWRPRHTRCWRLPCSTRARRTLGDSTWCSMATGSRAATTPTGWKPRSA